MDKHQRYVKIWAWLYKLLHGYIVNKFNMSHEDFDALGPCIVIPNHVTAWDPLLVAMSFPKKQMYFVASEHLFRKGLVSSILNFLVAPISRKKASMGTDTVRNCLRHLKAGHSVCLFAEGEATWNGISGKVFPATGKLVKSSGATLVTYKLEGAYLSKPRWGKGVKRGRVKGHPVRVYPPEELRVMSPGEITDAINADIFENAWQRAKEEPVHYKGKSPAENIETALFLCPGCRKIGTIRGENSKVKCRNCNFEAFFTELGTFEPPQPFENLAQWDEWQFKELEAFKDEQETLFSDEDTVLTKIGQAHESERIAKGRLIQSAECISCGAVSFKLSEIEQMAIVQTHILLLLTVDGEYYEIHTNRPTCLRKYLAVWQRRAA